jgi:ribonuclease D
VSASTSPRYLDAQDAWDAFAPSLGAATRVALDMEADGFHRYPERVSLIQVALPSGDVAVIDPLAVTDLAALGGALADRIVTKVVHSADYDLRSLDRDHAFRIHALFDTSVAAQFCGSTRLGLGNVLAEYAGVMLTKSKQLQRLDWSRRPLSADALAYAANDVAYLLELADLLSARLIELGRLSWVEEECRRLERIRYRAPEPPERAFLTVVGARDLSDEGRALLREVYVWRDAEARRCGRPPYMLASNEALLALAESPNGTLAHVPGLRRYLAPPVEERLRAAMARGRTAPPIRWPRNSRGEDWTHATQTRLKRLKLWRTGEAERLALDAGAVWPLDHLKMVAMQPDTASAELDHGDPRCVRDWQWRELGDSFERHRRDVLGDRGGGNAPARDGDSDVPGVRAEAIE